MKILLLNANTSALVTGKVEAAARAAAPPGVEIRTATGEFGATVIATRAEHAIAEHAALSLAAAHAPGCDAVVIAVSYDTGLRAVRELLDIPVVGMTEAGLLTACMLGGRIGVVVFGRRVLPMYQELIAGYGLAGRIAGWRVLESSAPYTQGEHPELDQEIVAAAIDLVERDFAETVLLAGAVMAGVPRRLQARAPVPLVDGLVCGVHQAMVLATLGHPKPTAGSFAAPGARSVSGVAPVLAGRLAASGDGK
jgi:allantoin racemase